MMYSPVLIVKRLKVQSQKSTLYDEVFHDGLNIIRSSDNSVGKSSIMDLIFYSLGGEVKTWIDELKKATSIKLQVEINNKQWTLSRSFPRGDSDMFIFDGDLDTSENNTSEWFKYPYRRSKHQNSFSQELFKILGFPEQKTDFDDNITLNQVLRLIYEDQITPIDRLFKDSDFDKEATRVAVFELLMGIDDLEVHWQRLNLRTLEKKQSEFNAEYRSLISNIDINQNLTKPENLQSHLNKIKSELEDKLSKLNSSVDKRLKSSEKEKDQEIDKKELSDISKNIEIFSFQLKEIEKSIQTLKIEEYDSQQFIESLNERVKALKDAESFAKFLGETTMKFCPSCLCPIETHSTDPAHCGLCKSKFDSGSSFENRLRMEQELSFQLKESILLQDVRSKRLDRFEVRKQEILQQLESTQRKYSNYIETTNSISSSLKDDIEKIGYIRKEIENVDNQASKIEKLNWLQKKINTTSVEIESSQNIINSLLLDREEYTTAISSFIEETTLDLIKKDLPVEEGFQDPKKVMVDFSKNRVFVDNKSRFSASSEVILKNCVLLATFMASIEFERVRLPRLLMLDNIEDKGMTEDRIHNFQKIIKDVSSRAKIKHQIIFTTSSISEDLNNQNYCVGEFYSKENKVFKIK